jgi:DNA repair exonuclease SbcCD ATPase subunit
VIRADGSMTYMLCSVIDDIDYEIKSEYEISKFKDVDILLLGDIHKYQQIAYNPIAVYPGSLIQQDFSEKIENHGYVLWELKYKTYKHIPVYNKYGMYNINLDNIENEFEDIKSEYPSFKIKYQEKDKLRLNEYKKILNNKFQNVQSITSAKLKVINDVTTVVDNNVNYNSIENQLLLLKSYFKDKKYNFEGIEELHLQYTSKEIKSNNNIWNPVKLSFSNLFSYGEDNEINFKDLKGSYGVFAPNTSGKSSLMEILSYICFDKTSYTNIVSKIVNSKKDNFKADFIFELNNKNYQISKVGTKNKETFKVDTTLFLVDNEFNKVEDLTKGKNELKKDIRDLIGEYDDFVLTALSLQNNRSSFNEKKQAERKELIQQFLNFDIFDNIYVQTNKKTNTLKSELNLLNSKLKDINLSEIDKEIEDLKYKILKNNSDKDVLKNDIEKVNNEINDLYKSIIDIDIKDNLEDLIDKISNQQKLILNKSKEIVQKETEYNNDQNTLIELSNMFVDINVNNIELTINKINNLNNSLNIKLNNLRNTNNNLEKFNNLKFNDECDECSYNLEVLNINKENESKKNILNEIELIKTDISNELTILGYEDLDKLKIFYNQIVENNNKKLLLEKSINNYKDLIHTLKENLEAQQLVLTNLEQKKLEVIDNLDKIKNNIEINDLISKLKNDIQLINKDINLIESDTNSINVNIQSLTIQKENNIKLKEEIDLKNKEYTKYSNYSESISKDGIPLLLIKNIIGNLEDEVNDILENIVKFRVKIELIDTDIDLYITYDNESMWDVATVSGMEKFITGLAIRIALINMSQLPRPNFICIDEGFGVLDKTNLSELKSLFEYLKDIFDFYIVISHIEILRDFVDNSINIDKVNGFSIVKY